MIRKLAFLSMLLCLGLMFVGCSSSSEGRLMKKLASKEIVFPSSLERIEGVSERHPDLTVPAVRFVVYVDSLQCSTCHLRRMPKYAQYASLETLYPDFQLVAIIWPNAESAETMAADIAHRSFPFDVFIDWDGSFMEVNPTIPQKRDFHCFLMGRDGHPVYAGDPVSSKGKEMALRNALYAIYDQK